jgi:regulation of enolase protein 1 (concanavalin A-like superfamily)
MTAIEWGSGIWLHKPPEHRVVDGELVVTTAHESDFWRSTGYDFIHYSGHGLLIDFPPNTAMELEFSARWTHEFDQAGLLLHADEAHWTKAGVEFADGVLGLGAVVTDEKSDWSVGQVPEWMGQRIRVRVSRSRDTITVRARTGIDPWRLVRLAPINPDLTWRAGPLAASPTRAGLEVTFHSWVRVPADDAIHESNH